HSILDELESNRLVNTTKVIHGKTSIKMYAVTSEGISFYKNILDPYEKLFPRNSNEGSSELNSNGTSISY
ncbi:MAG: hypothetical protein ACJ71B_12065, partial [Nitrososphaera sp.]